MYVVVGLIGKKSTHTVLTWQVKFYISFIKTFINMLYVLETNVHVIYYYITMYVVVSHAADILHWTSCVILEIAQTFMSPSHLYFQYSMLTTCTCMYSYNLCQLSVSFSLIKAFILMFPLDAYIHMTWMRTYVCMAHFKNWSTIKILQSSLW